MSFNIIILDITYTIDRIMEDGKAKKYLNNCFTTKIILKSIKYKQTKIWIATAYHKRNFVTINICDMVTLTKFIDFNDK